MEYLRGAIDKTRRLFVRDPKTPQAERWFEGQVAELFGEVREGFQPEDRFEFRSLGGDKIDTPVLDYLVCEIGSLDAYAKDAELPQRLSSGEFVYRNAGALDRLVEATHKIVGLDGYPYSGTPETVVTLHALPRFVDPQYRMAAFRHREYLWELFKVLRENPGSWLVTDYGSRRVAEHSSLRTTDHIVIGAWQRIVVQKVPVQELVAT